MWPISSSKKILLDRIHHLERLLDEERTRNRELQEQVLLMAEKPIVPVEARGPAKVYYMDDTRLLELEEEGHGPT